MDTTQNTLNEWFGLSGKTVLLWGCAGQIGSALAQSFARLGADIVGTRTSEKGLEESKAAVSGLPGKFIAGAVCDITNAEALRGAIAALKKSLNGRPIDITIMVAGGVVKGVGPKDKFEDFDDETFERTVRLNYTAPVSALRQSIPLMEGAAHPLLGAICSMSYPGKLSRVFGYRASKAALEDTLSFLTQELMKKGPNWTVLGWRPGFVLAEQNRAILDEVRRNAIIEHMPRGDWQTADEVARAIVATCTPAFRACHGTVIDIAGGFGHAGLGMKAL